MVGRLLSRIWLRETARVNDTAFDLLAPAPDERILEIGFGPGRTLARLAAAGAEVTGVDISATMLAAASRRNAAPITGGRMHLHQGDAMTLPVADHSLDAVIGVHTIYFWPNPAATFTAMALALRPGGRLVLAFRAGDNWDVVQHYLVRSGKVAGAIAIGIVVVSVALWVYKRRGKKRE